MNAVSLKQRFVSLRLQARTAIYQWWQGLSSAFCVHKALFYFVHDHQIWVKTLQCLTLNGLIFLGSIAAFRFGVAPTLQWLLAGTVRKWAGDGTADFLQRGFELAYNALWLLPAYIVSLIVSGMWYNDIAARTVAVHLEQRPKRRPGSLGSQQQRQQAAPQVAIGQEVYRLLLFTIFLLQTLLVGALPLIGRAAELLLLSWLYAFYCFDYKWALMAHPLQSRIAYFERHWAFLGGFGSVVTLATFWLPFYAGAALMALLFPLFIIIACDISPEDQPRTGGGTKAAENPDATTDAKAPADLSSLRIFMPAELVTAFMLRHVRWLLSLLGLLTARR